MLFIPSDNNSNMFDNIHPAGQAVLHLHRLHHSALLAVSNLIRPCNVYYIWCMSPRTLIYNFQQAKYSINGTWSPTATVTDFTTPGMGLRMIRDVSIGTFGRGEVRGDFLFIVDVSPWRAWLVAGLQLRREEQTHSTLFPYTLCKINWDPRREETSRQTKLNRGNAI